MNTMVAERFVADFERVKTLLPGTYVPWLRRAREEAFMAFLDKGLPTTRDEDWKYTSVAQIEKRRFILAPSATNNCDDLGCVGAKALSGARLLVFVDGRYAPELSRLGTLPAGIAISSLGAVLARDPERVHAALTCPPAGYASGFAALNAAFVSDGAYVHLAPGTELAEPLHLLFLASTEDMAAQVHNVIVAEADSRVCIVEHHASLDDMVYFSNVVTDIDVARGAVVEHHKLQQEAPQAFHVAAINVEVGSAARFASSSFAFGAALARTDINVALNATKATCNLDGLTMSDGRQHVDHHTRIDHAQPQCSSREFYKGVLDGAARAVFNGKVIVHAGAQQSDALQTNRNLLLSDQAEVDTKPQLEIWADDVKCGHGATVGQLDPDQIFYLRARGIDAAAARALLVFAFANEIVARIELASLRTRLERLLRTRLPQSAGVMQ